MGDLSTHFSRYEFACKCDYGCGLDTVDVKLLEFLEDIRSHFNCAVIISSGHRCPQHNKDEGGEENSQHLLGKAADFEVRGVGAWQVQNYFDNRFPKRYGMGRYSDFTHIDVRPFRKRW